MRAKSSKQRCPALCILDLSYNVKYHWSCRIGGCYGHLTPVEVDMASQESTMKDVKIVQGCQCYGVKPIKSYFANKGNCGKMFWAPFYYLKYFSFPL